MHLLKARGLAVVAAISLSACGSSALLPAPEYTCEVVHVYPHDRAAFTEGLFYWEGKLYEGTGEYGESSIRKVDLETGKYHLTDFLVVADVGTVIHPRALGDQTTGSNFEFRIVRRDGEVEWLANSWQPIYGPTQDEQGEPEGYERGDAAVVECRGHLVVGQDGAARHAGLHGGEILRPQVRDDPAA